jgi:ribose 5-phosphate isomerase A
MTPETKKRLAAEAAVREIRDDMAVGLGTGSTAAFAIAAIGRRMREEGLRITAIPTSRDSEAKAVTQGIPLVSFAQCPRLDLTIDGADWIDPRSLDVIKGNGGALLWEKIVAAASDRLIIIADDTKLVARLGDGKKIPVEVVPFGWETTAARIETLGGMFEVRRGADGTAFTTDSGHIILDCVFEPAADPAALERALGMTIGVVETGLFIGMAGTVFVAGAESMIRLDRSAGTPGGVRTTAFPYEV